MEELIPSNFHFSQNFPNPFKECTKIKYSLPIKTNVCLTILNSKGTVIKELVNKTQEAGTYEINFTCNNCAVGDYFCQLQAGDPLDGSPRGQTGQGFQQVVKMVLLD